MAGARGAAMAETAMKATERKLTAFILIIGLFGCWVERVWVVKRLRERVTENERRGREMSMNELADGDIKV